MLNSIDSTHKMGHGGTLVAARAVKQSPVCPCPPTCTNKLHG